MEEIAVDAATSIMEFSVVQELAYFDSIFVVAAQD